MNSKNSHVIDRLLVRYPIIKQERANILLVYEILADAFSKGNYLYICGNGGSAADALHIVGELMKSFVLERPIKEDIRAAIKDKYPDQSEYLIENLQEALPAYPLLNNTSLETAYSNDVCADMSFAQQVYGYGRKNDILLGISTSGNAKNVINAARIASVIGMKTVAITGKDGGDLKRICDNSIVVPLQEVYEIQEVHVPIYHAICMMLEEEFFNKTV